MAKRTPKIIKEYEAIKNNERYDCSVVALTLVSELTYREMHAEFQSLGRKRNKRTSRWLTVTLMAKHLMISQLSQKALRQPNGSRYTVKSIAAKYRKGTYIVFLNSHVLAMKDGVVADWSAGRRHRVSEMYQVVSTIKEPTPRAIGINLITE